MNKAFSCRSYGLSYKVGEKGRKPRNRGGGDHRTEMLKTLVATLALAAAASTAQAASAVNLDQQPRTLIVTEGGSKSELALGAGETVDFCPSGCFVTMPNGDIEALTGSETVEISGGVGRVK